MLLMNKGNNQGWRSKSGNEETTWRRFLSSLETEQSVALYQFCFPMYVVEMRTYFDREK
jgi:hypothetical protein